MKKWGPLPRSLMGLMVREPFLGKPDGDEDISVHEFFRTRFQCDEVRRFSTANKTTFLHYEFLREGFKTIFVCYE